MTRLVVVGGDAAGMSAASEARRGNPDLDIVVLERTAHVSYAACGMPYWLGGWVPDRQTLVAVSADEFRERRRIDVRLHADVAAIDPGHGEVALADGTRVGYDALVVATGARPALPDVPGVDLPGVHALRDMDSAIALGGRLDQVAGGRALMVGSGPIGLEMCEALCRRGMEVHLLERSPRLVPSLHQDVSEAAAAALEGGCTTARVGSNLQAIAPHGDRGLEVTIDGATEPFDLVLLGTGVTPNSEAAVAAGCRPGPRGAISIDPDGRTSVEGVWAAGDCATARHRVSGQEVWIPLATTANAQGRAAGRSVTGRDGGFPGVLGSWVSSAFGVGIGATGLDVDAARAAGFTPAAITRSGRDRSGYMPGAGRATVRLVWDEPTGRLLGAQSSGGADISSRLHALAVAIAAGMTVRELAGVDLGYAPPVSALRDPIQLAAAAVIGDAP